MPRPFHLLSGATPQRPQQPAATTDGGAFLACRETGAGSGSLPSPLLFQPVATSSSSNEGVDSSSSHSHSVSVGIGMGPPPPPPPSQQPPQPPPKYHVTAATAAFAPASVATAPRAAPPAHIEVRELERAYDTLRREYERTTKNADGYRSEMRRLRAVKEEQGKQLTMNQRVLDSVAKERRALQEQCEKQRDAIRRLEYRLSRSHKDNNGPGGASCLLAEENRALRDRVGEGEERVKELEEALVVRKEERARLVREVEELRTALAVKVEHARHSESEAPTTHPPSYHAPYPHPTDPSSGNGGGGLISASLFRQLAARKLEAQSLVQELVDAEARVAGLRDQVEQGKEALAHERRRREDAETERGLLGTQLGRAVEKARTLAARVAALEEEKGVLESQVAEGRKAAKALALLKAEHKSKAEAHKAQLEAAERRVQAVQREKEATEGLLRKAEGAKALAEEKLSEERRRAKEAHDAAWAVEGKEREWALERRMMDEEAVALAQRVTGLQEAKRACEAALQGARLDRDAAVSALAREKEGQVAMRVEMESLLGELKAAGLERRKLENALAKAQREAEKEKRRQQEQGKEGPTTTTTTVAAALAEEVQLARRLLKEETLHRRALEQELLTARLALAAHYPSPTPQPQPQPHPKAPLVPVGAIPSSPPPMAPLSTSPSSAASGGSAFHARPQGVGGGGGRR